MNLNTTRLVKCREELGLSKQETARRIGVSQPAYLRYESGDRKPSIQVIKEIAKVLNTSVDYLIDLTDSPKPNTIEVDKSDNKALFEIIERCSNMDLKQQEHLLAYIKAMK